MNWKKDGDTYEKVTDESVREGMGVVVYNGETGEFGFGVIVSNELIRSVVNPVNFGKTSWYKIKIKMMDLSKYKDFSYLDHLSVTQSYRWFNKLIEGINKCISDEYGKSSFSINQNLIDDELNENIKWDFEDEDEDDKFKVIIIKWKKNDYWAVLHTIEEDEFYTIYAINSEFKFYKRIELGGDLYVCVDTLGDGVKYNSTSLNTYEQETIKEIRNPFYKGTTNSRIYDISYIKDVFGDNLTFDDTSLREKYGYNGFGQSDMENDKVM